MVALSVGVMGRASRRSVPAWWAALCEAYLRSLTRRGRRPKTIETYHWELRGLGAWLTQHGVQRPEDITGAELEAWQDELCQRARPNTQQVAAYAARGLLKWAGRRGLVDPGLWERVDVPRVPELPPRPIPRADLQLILDAFATRQRTDLWWLRTRALFWLIFASGARISEALSLERGSIRDDGTPVIQKGGRRHLLVLNDQAKRVIALYEAARLDACRAMFASLTARRGDQRLAKQEAQRAWDRLCTELGIVRFTSHQIRHSCATTLRRQGVDLVLIQQQLGHRSLRQLLRYVLVEVEDRRRAVARLDGALAG